MIDQEIGISSDFRKDLEHLINKYSMENGSNTPDFILAKYLNLCLLTFDVTVNMRDKWYNFYPRNKLELSEIQNDI